MFLFLYSHKYVLKVLKPSGCALAVLAHFYLGEPIALRSQFHTSFRPLVGVPLFLLSLMTVPTPHQRITADANEGTASYWR